MTAGGDIFVIVISRTDPATKVSALGGGKASRSSLLPLESVNLLSGPEPIKLRDQWKIIVTDYETTACFSGLWFFTRNIMLRARCMYSQQMRKKLKRTHFRI